MGYREGWVYSEVIKNYRVNVSDSKVAILFEDGDVYAEFKLVKDDDPDPRFNLGYFIYLDEELINDDIDFYGTFDEAVSSCLYYFYTRF